MVGHTPPHERRMPLALREHAQRLGRAYKSNRQSESRHKKEISRIMQAAKLSEARLGDHWQWIKKKLHAGKWTMRDLMRACLVIKKMPRFGLHPSLVNKVHMITIVGNPNDLKPDAWSERANFMLGGLNSMIQKSSIQERVGMRADREGKASVGPDGPSSLVVGDQADRHNNTTVNNSLLVSLNTETELAEWEGTLREVLWPNVPRVCLPFPEGVRLFPDFLVCPSTLERTKLEPGSSGADFAIRGMIAQLPRTIPHVVRATLISEIKQTDLRKRPSSLPFMDRIKQAAKTKHDEVAMTDVVQGLAHAYWQVGKNGAYSFFYRSLQSLGIEAVVDYNFDWSNSRGAKVLDGAGKKLRIYRASPPPRRRVASHYQKRFEDTKEGKRLLANSNAF